MWVEGDIGDIGVCIPPGESTQTFTVIINSLYSVIAFVCYIHSVLSIDTNTTR